MLKINQTLYCEAGEIRVIDFIDAGGQAEVYKVRLHGQDYALKYYLPESRTKNLRKNIKDLTRTQMDSKHFIWPLYYVENGEQFGYIMNLIPSGYYDIKTWLRGDFDMDVETLLKACAEICEGFHQIHSEGFSYKDISDANIVINPDTGNILIFDNDNITPNHENCGVKGTPKFMAPELVSGVKTIDGRHVSPNRTTDLHSLAVLLFELLMCEHPLEGNFHNKCSVGFNDLEWDEEIYGINGACFIFKDEGCLDRYIDINEPSHEAAKKMWLFYPKGLRKLFLKAFTDGISNPNARPGSEEWTEAFFRMMGMLYKCPSCNKPHFINWNEVKRNNGKCYCNNCANEISLPILKLHDYCVVLSNNKLLYAQYFNIRGKDKFETILKVEYKSHRLRLKNISNHNVVYNGRNVSLNQWTDYIEPDKDVGYKEPVAKIIVDKRDFLICIPE